MDLNSLVRLRSVGIGIGRLKSLSVRTTMDRAANAVRRKCQLIE